MNKKHLLDPLDYVTENIGADADGAAKGPPPGKPQKAPISPSPSALRRPCCIQAAPRIEGDRMLHGIQGCPADHGLGLIDRDLSRNSKYLEALSCSNFYTVRDLEVLGRSLDVPLVHLGVLVNRLDLECDLSPYASPARSSRAPHRLAATS